jgi:hypothetical protein
MKRSSSMIERTASLLRRKSSMKDAGPSQEFKVISVQKVEQRVPLRPPSGTFSSLQRTSTLIETIPESHSPGIFNH